MQAMPRIFVSDRAYERLSRVRSLHMVIGLSKRQPPKPPSPSYQKPQESYILHGVSIAQFRFCVSSFCNFLLAWLHSSCVVWPTGLGNFHKHFLTNLATELLTHSVLGRLPPRYCYLRLDGCGAGPSTVKVISPTEVQWPD